eukprot:TRINITY_DN1089_c0_g1_i1.p1 TRINITY_DN1089_c0_g1~~TRINITY_DN1089_c0_g1_i1.p1  ORF type:complete len:345 (-),score=100.48 TRINITY_DN1089_c0_g1_i1:89-1123(-)
MGCTGSKEQKSQSSTSKGTSTSTTSGSSAEPVKNTPKTAAQGGKVGDNYDIMEEIGRGAFSVVKKAKSKRTGEEFAIKFIEKQYVDKQDLVLLGREIDIMKKVSHPNVLNLEEVYETDDTIALVMELVNGGELFYKIVEKGNYSEKDAAKIVRQMCKGVEYLHEQGIAHRDMKPENLLCATDTREEYKPFRVVIADFGLSKAFNEEALATSCGTPDYVAPEVITAEGTYDKSVDMWSCGVITYVLLCGFSPFLSSNQTGLFEKIMKAEYDFPDPEWTHISDQAKDFIRKLLVKDQKARYTAAQCLAHPWLSGEFSGSGAELANGTISDKMKSYNEQRKATKKTL